MAKGNYNGKQTRRVIVQPEQCAAQILSDLSASQSLKTLLLPGMLKKKILRRLETVSFWFLDVFGEDFSAATSQAMKELQANREVDPRYRRAVDAAVMIVKHERGTKEAGLNSKWRKDVLPN